MSDRTRQKIQRCFGKVRECLGKPYDEYDFSSLAILKVLETDSALLRDVAPQTIWPLHTYRVSENLDCINWMNARKSVIRRTLTNVTMTILSIALSCALAVPVTFSASLGQIEDLTKNISWLYWVRRIPPHALAYLQGAVPQLLVAGVVALPRHPCSSRASVLQILFDLSLLTSLLASVDLFELDVDFVASLKPTISNT
jgi:ABC-type phosphate/phosphonate transport system permease subunit